MIKKGSCIEVENIGYYNSNKPVTIFIRGYCLYNCEQGEETEIKTITGHIVRGIVSKGKTFYLDSRSSEKDAKEILMIKKPSN